METEYNISNNKYSQIYRSTVNLTEWVKGTYSSVVRPGRKVDYFVLKLRMRGGVLLLSLYAAIAWRW